MARKLDPGLTEKEVARRAIDALAAVGAHSVVTLVAADDRLKRWVAHPLSGDIVNAGQAFAWNPSVTRSKVEETCLAFEDRIEIITASPNWPTLPVEIEGRTYPLPNVLSL